MSSGGAKPFAYAIVMAGLFGASATAQTIEPDTCAPYVLSGTELGRYAPAIARPSLKLGAAKAVPRRTHGHWTT